MTKTETIFIKYLRLRLECSWTKLYSHWYNRYILRIPFTNKENNLSAKAGRDLCRKAQDILNENWEDEC